MGADSARQRNDHAEALLRRALSPSSGDPRLVFADQ
jgi:D-alanyl-D-alanine carboxypeptidase